jgi:hypothetical protein
VHDKTKINVLFAFHLNNIANHVAGLKDFNVMGKAKKVLLAHYAN